MPTNEDRNEVVNSTKGFGSSLFFHSLLILLGITPLATFNAPIWEEEQPGMEVALGFPDEGMGDDAPSPGNNDPGGPPPSSSAARPNDIAPSTPPPASSQPAPSEPSKTSGENVLSSESSEEVAVSKAREERRKQAERDQIEAERRRNAELTAEANRRAEADRRAKEDAARREAEYASAKNKYGGLLGGTGSGRGNTGKPGNQGDPNGDPNAKNLEGIHTGGKGRIGGGLGSRGLVSEPKIEESSQKTGIVIIKVCVNRSGSVTSAEYTQKGSTTNDASLIAIARRNALKFKFTQAEVSEQCGTITYDFKVQ